ncbi:DUF1214 domain-containing protein [Pelagimonas varians]|uniref:Outer membrane porin F n=1 Tax=Pelagimonas varians TaxID=696760 RepID=A0A238KVS0_9RHOB|nr:DUF1214 domain-containing protein [Pelagimonas varians]PYG28103.1 hypothetical protein C8N36_113135 [Pelagimonas varians]SMX46730.1 Outer membrane porin F precursor [Pelagimonas varians]
MLTAVSVVALCATMAVTSVSAQTLSRIGTDNRAQAIGEMTDARVMVVLRSEGRVKMSGQFFETDSTDLSSDAPVILFKMAKVLETLPEMRLAIVGHTDSEGDFAYNVDLAQRRAEAVRNALLAEPNNVAPERLVAMGAGPISPVASNLSDEGRALNRRVEFVLLDEALMETAATPAETAQEPTRFIENTVIESLLGTFEFEKGFPTPDATERLFDMRLAYRAVEVIQQNVFGASLYAMRKGYADFGAGKPNQVLVWENLMDAKSEFLTANNTTVYAMTFLDLKADGPTVVDAPPQLLGLLNDMWMRYVGDIGNAGPDKGEGGKFLILPPGYEGEVPDGYYVMESNTYGVWMALRAFQDEDGTTTGANERYKKLQIYPLAKADNPPPTEIIPASGEEILTVHSENYALLEELGHLVEEEHPNAVDGAQKFLLASIGMEFGKPFEPSAEDKEVLESASLVGAAVLRANMWNYTGDQKYIYEDRKWWNPFVGGVYTFDPNGYLDYDAQAFFAAYATGVTPAMATKKPGVGSQYLCTHTDGEGVPLDGAKTYKLTIPADVPAKDFWSVVVYDSANRSMMATSQEYPAISSYSDAVANDDGTIDLYFGPEAPEGKENNWVETDPAKGWTAIMRLYGPLEPFFDKTWKANDFELVE